MSQQEIIQFEQNSPIKKIARIHRLSFNRLTNPLAELGMARGTLPFLMEVLCHDGVIQQDVSRELSIDRAATARSLQQLEESGLITREENENNRRQKYVYATDKAREMQDGILELLGEHKNKLFTGFTEQEKNEFLKMLDRIIANMRTE